MWSDLSDLENEEPVRKEDILVDNGKRRSNDLGDVDINRVTKRARTLSSSAPEDVEIHPDPPPTRVAYRRVLRHIPLDIPYIPITTQSGSRVYLRILPTSSPDDDQDVPQKLISTVGGSNRQLFADWDKIKAEARILKDNFHRSLATIVRNEAVVEGYGGAVRGKEAQEDLWVEKYRPRNYIDLLSEESTNRALLHWLKLWDKSVFGNDFLAKVNLTKEKYAKLDAKEKESKSKWHSKKFAPPQIQEDYDETGRPKLKVALLYGPPGLGKTTAAHIIAKHAGYSVREMNASDDRSVDFFRKVLDDALSSRSEIFHDGKPNCLVIDEIDGAPLPAVTVLCDLISGNATEKGKKKLKKVLKRPIICICNDLYAPALKELKKLALILPFNAVTVPALAERLEEICSRESLGLDTTTILSLCDKSDCDIRSCLSTLQFLKTKKVSPKDALYSLVGMKDKTKGLFPVWSDIFTIPDGKKKYSTDEDNSKPQNRFKNMLRTAQSFGEYEKLLGGVFENYLRVKFKDCYFESILDGLSWTNWFHDINSEIAYSQNYVLMGYLPIYFVASHFLFGQRSGWLKLNYPSNDITQKIARSRSTISNVLSEITPSIGRFLDPYDAVTDLFPSLMGIIQPGTIRPVPTQIWSAGERATLQNVVHLMISYNLSYIQMKGAETGAYNFILEPDVGTLVKFKVQEISGTKQNFAYSIKQLIAREIDTEKMRRNDHTKEPELLESSNKNDTPTSQPDFKVPKPLTKSLPPVTVDPTMTTDFFGRQVKISAQSSQDLLALKRRSSGIYFRFKEGYSNAVRRFVKMKDLE